MLKTQSTSTTAAMLNMRENIRGLLKGLKWGTQTRQCFVQFLRQETIDGVGCQPYCFCGFSAAFAKISFSRRACSPGTLQHTRRASSPAKPVAHFRKRCGEPFCAYFGRSLGSLATVILSA